jgi:hypothetical protein
MAKGCVLTGFEDCLEGECAWWSERGEKCSIALIPERLTRLSDAVMTQSVLMDKGGNRK